MMTAAKRVLIVVGLCLLAMLQLAGGTSTENCNDGANFGSYGFGYVKITDQKTKQSVYLVDTQIHTHCCGDMGQYTSYINHISAAAREYIESNMEKKLEDYNLTPTFTKCLKSETEAEGIRSKKVSYFTKLGYKALEVTMGIPDLGCDK